VSRGARREPDRDAVEVITAKLAAGAKYRGVHPDTIAQVVRWAARSDVAQLERRSRARLHKVAALHLLTARPAALRRRVEAADPGDLSDPQRLRAWCREMLAAHVSTAERLVDLDRFYPAILGTMPPPRTVADVACALNTFTLPWLRDVTDARYVGYDFNEHFVSIGNAFLARTYPGCHVVQQDVLSRDAAVVADLALLLKTYHCIQDRQPGAGLRLVERLAARHVVVSFPTRAMNGRAALFARRHIDELASLAGRRSWGVWRVTLHSEDLLVIRKADA